MRLHVPLLAVALFATSVASAADKPNPFFPYPMKVDRLKNGLTVVRIPFNSPGLVSYYTAMRVGSRNEVEANHTGFAHFFEHIMFKGTAKYPEGQREGLLGKLGFNDNAFTTDDCTVYHATGPSSALPQLIDVESDRFKHLQYTEQTFMTESKAVLGEYHKNAAGPDLKIEEQLAGTAFTQHTYKHTTLGFYEDIKKMPGYYQYSTEFFKRWYTPDNAILVIVGDFDDAKLMTQVKAAYGDWQGKSASVSIPKEPAQTSPRTARIDWPMPTLSQHILAWHTPAASLKTPDAAIQNVLVPYLVGTTSPLYKELVLDKQLTETIGSGYFDHRDPNLFTLVAVLKDEKNRTEVDAAFKKAVAEVASGKVDQKRMEDIKKHLRYANLMALETTDQVAGKIAFAAAVYGTPDAYAKSNQLISQVTSAQLASFAKKYLTEANRTTLTLDYKPAAVSERAEKPATEGKN